MRKLVITAIFVFAAGAGVSFAQNAADAKFAGACLHGLSDNCAADTCTKAKTSEVKKAGPENKSSSKSSGVSRACSCGAVINFDRSALANMLDESYARAQAEAKKAAKEKSAREEASRKYFDDAVNRLGFEKTAVRESDKAYVAGLAELSKSKGFADDKTVKKIKEADEKAVFRIYTMWTTYPNGYKSADTKIVNLTTNKHLAWWDFDAVKEYEEFQNSVKALQKKGETVGEKRQAGWI